MAIEFNCSACGQLITAPDETVGRKARCPQCLGAVTIPDVPPIGTSQPAASANGTQPALSDSPGAGPPPGVSTPQSLRVSPLPGSASQQENPYVSPITVQTAVDDRPDVETEIHHRQVTVGQLLGQTWAVFFEQLGTCVAVAFTLIGLVVGAGVALFGLNEIAFGASDIDDLIAFVPVLIPLGLAAFTVYCWLLLGQAILMIKLCRGEHANLGDLFAGGPYLWRGIGLMLLVSLIEIAVTAACLFPALVIQKPVAEFVCQIIANVANYVIGLILFLCVYFIVDRDMGVFQSIDQSAQHMSGNKFVLFVAQLIAAVVSVVFLTVTCSLGILFVMPYFMVLSAMVYVLATGQPTAADRHKALRARIRR